MAKKAKRDYFTLKAEELQMEHTVTWDTAILIAYLDTIGFRLYEVVQLLEQKKENEQKKGKP